MFKSIAHGISIGVDAVGFAIILLGLLWAITRCARGGRLAFDARDRHLAR